MSHNNNLSILSALSAFVQVLYRGGSHIDMVYVYVPAFWGTFFAKFGIAIGGGFSSETKEPKLHKLGVFWANYCKKHPIWSKLGAFLSKMVYWWVGNLAKNWYRDTSDFRGPAGTSTYDFGERTPPPGFVLIRAQLMLDVRHNFLAHRMYSAGDPTQPQFSGKVSLMSYLVLL